MGPTWVLSAPDGPRVGPTNLAIGMWCNTKVMVTESQCTVYHNKYANSDCIVSLVFWTIRCGLYSTVYRNLIHNACHMHNNDTQLIELITILRNCCTIRSYRPGNKWKPQETGYFNSFWPSDTIWQQISGLTLVLVMVCCLTAPSHYLI